MNNDFNNQSPIVISPDKSNYTPIEDAICDIKTIKLLKDIFSAKGGALTAFNQYLFQSFISNGINDNLSNALKDLSNNALNHLSLLADAILKFGGTPNFKSSDNFWSSRYVNYDNSALNILNNNIKFEENAIKNITNAINKIQNSSLKTLLQEIIDDKNNNINVLKGFLPK